MKHVFFSAALLFLFFSCATQPKKATPEVSRTTEDFNFDWEFRLGEDAPWSGVRLPHDWSILAGYQQENTAASTGFVPGGIGYYRKDFSVPETDRGRKVRVEFDGVFCNSEVWINGHALGFRPNGYSSFGYDLTEHLNYGETPNQIVVKADHSAYADTRWYTGSGIYRGVRLVTTAATHIPQWGVRVVTPEVSATAATVMVSSEVENVQAGTEVRVSILDPSGKEVASKTAPAPAAAPAKLTFELTDPQRWDTENAHLYVARTQVLNDGKPVDELNTTFGIRSIRFDAEQGFLLNGKRTKLKGVNLHHDAGAVGAAVTKAVWEYRVRKLKSIGVNAIRMSHNPHSSELMEVCDEMGMLVMDEFFDEWHRPKDKSLVYLGDNKAKGAIAAGYSEYFMEWAERDLKDLIRRDFNHPSVIMWSIGNEIEWTFPKYSQAYNVINPGIKGYGETPIFDPTVVRPVADSILGPNDSLAIVAKMLSKWVKEEDTTRPTVCGSVRPSIALVSGYGTAVDVLGLNYRQQSYDAAHAAYPDLKLLGSENWGDYSEWREVKDRDFVAGMFAWTGFAYMGEGGPWPRKGLNISFFDYAGFKTPRGHFYECLWTEAPKTYLVTTPAATSEFSYDETEGWSFEMQKTPPPVWSELRRWEWYKANEHWNYETAEPIVVQAYTNCDEAELFLNGTSRGRQSLTDFTEDNVMKWLVPYENGELVLKGFRDGAEVAQTTLSTTGQPAKLALSADKAELRADRYDLTHVALELRDAAGKPVRDLPQTVRFELSGPGELLAIDNGWERNVEHHYKSTVTTHNGRALAIVRAGAQPGALRLTATVDGVASGEVVIRVR